MRRVVAVVVVIVLAIMALWWWRTSHRQEVAPATRTTSGSSRVAASLPTATAGTAGRIDPRTVQRAAISGRVTTASKQRLPGARVCVRGSSDELDAALFREPSCATTDAQGAY